MESDERNRMPIVIDRKGTLEMKLTRARAAATYARSKADLIAGKAGVRSDGRREDRETHDARDGDGPRGWAGASWQDNSLNTLMQSSSNASQGSYSLHIQSGGGYWFGVEPFGPVDLSSRTSIRVDLTSTTGTSSALALKVGPGWDWCQITVPGWFTTPHVGEADMGAGGALTFDLTTLDDSCRSKLTEVHALYLAVNGGSDTYIDYVRAY